MASATGETIGPMQRNRSRNITLQELASQCTEEEPADEAKIDNSVAISSSGSIETDSVQNCVNPEGREDGMEGAGPLLIPLSSPATNQSGRSVHIIQEIIDTEKTYVQDLCDVIEGYETPCINTQLFDDDDDFVALFGNMDELHEFNSSLLCQLEQAEGDPVRIGSCFIENEQNFRQYTLYCTNYPRSVAVLASHTQSQNEVADFLKVCQNRLGHALPLGSYLLKPVQRILKYRLLLMDLAKHTDLSSEGNAILQKALATMTSVAEHINEMKKLHETTVRVQEIQSLLTDWKGDDLTKYGRLVLEDSFRVVGARDPRQVFLFEKLLLVTKHREDGKYSYKNDFETGDMSLTESFGKDPTSFQVSQYQNIRNGLTIHTGTPEVKQKWIATIRRLIIDSWPNLPPKARKIVLGLQEGKDAVPPPLLFSPSELPVLTAPIGIAARKRLNTSRSLRRPYDPQRKAPRKSMPASLLESILPGDVKESRFGNNDVFSSPPPSATNNEFVSLVYEEAESKLRPISLCNPLSEDPDVKGDAVREKSADLSEGSRVNEAEMIDPENLSPRPTVRKRANRVYKEDLQKFRQSRQYLDRSRHRTMSESHAVSSRENETVNRANDVVAPEETEAVAGVVTLPRARSPFARKPVMKKRADRSPVFTRRSEALRPSRRKKTKSMFLLPSPSSEWLDATGAFGTRPSSYAGDLAASEDSVDKESDSNSERDVTILDSTFQTYTIPMGDQWHSFTGDNDHSPASEEKPFHPDLPPQETAEEAADEAGQSSPRALELSSGNDEASFEDTTIMTPEVDDKVSFEKTTTYQLEDQLMSENEVDIWTHEESTFEVEAADSSKPSSPRNDDYSLGILNHIGTVDGSVVEETGDENEVVGGELESDVDGRTKESGSDEAVCRGTTEFVLVEEERVDNKTHKVDSTGNDLAATESPPVVPLPPSRIETETVSSLSDPSAVSASTRVPHRSSTSGNSSDELSKRETQAGKEEREDGRQPQAVHFTPSVAKPKDPLPLGPGVDEGVSCVVESAAATDGRGGASTLERELEIIPDSDESVFWEKMITTVNEVADNKRRKQIGTNRFQDTSKAERRSDGDLQFDRECSFEGLAPQPESIFDASDVNDAIAALSILSPPASKEPPQPLQRTKKDKQGDGRTAMMSLEEALEMDRLPYSAGLSEQISTSTEFPVWLQRTAPVMMRRKSRSLEHLQLVCLKQGNGDRTALYKSELTQQRKDGDTVGSATASANGEKKKAGKVMMLARNYSRMLKRKVHRGRGDKQQGRRAISAQNSPGIGRRLAELGIRQAERSREDAETTGTREGDGVNIRAVNEAASCPSRRRSLQVSEDIVNDSASISSEASGVLVDTQNDESGKDAVQGKGWVKKLAAKFQGK